MSRKVTRRYKILVDMVLSKNVIALFHLMFDLDLQRVFIADVRYRDRWRKQTAVDRLKNIYLYITQEIRIGSVNL